MNYNLIALFCFVIVLIILFWIIPSDKGERITKCLTSLFQVLPITKITDAIISINKKVPPKQD